MTESAPNRMIIWGAFAFAIVIYGVVGMVVVGPGGVAKSADLPVWLFPAVGLFLGIAALLAPTFLAGRELPSMAPPIDGKDLVIWSLDESVSIVGMISFFLGGSATAFFCYLAASLGLLLIHRPRG